LSDNDHFDMSKQRGRCKVDCFKIGITEELWLEELFGETRAYLGSCSMRTVRVTTCRVLLANGLVVHSRASLFFLSG
jgi:hypothetical protein